MPGGGVGAWARVPNARSLKLVPKETRVKWKRQCAWRAERLKCPWIPSWDHVCAPQDAPVRSPRVRPDMGCVPGSSHQPAPQPRGACAALLALQARKLRLREAIAGPRSRQRPSRLSLEPTFFAASLLASLSVRERADGSLH